MLQLLSCGNDWVGADEDQRKSCYSLDGVDDGRIGPGGLSWKIHSQFTEDLYSVLGQTAVTLSNIGTYILGEKTSQFLPKGSHVWVEGPRPAIEGMSFRLSCAVAFSPTEFVVIGGSPTSKYGNQFSIYNAETNGGTQLEHSHQHVPPKNRGHACTLIKGDRPLVIVTGGLNG